MPDQSNHQSLKELTPESASIGMWLLQVAEHPREWVSASVYNGRRCVGKRFEAMLVSEDASVYCIGFVRRKRDSASGNEKFAEAMQTVRYKTMWEASKISLAKEKP